MPDKLREDSARKALAEERMQPWQEVVDAHDLLTHYLLGSIGAYPPPDVRKDIGNAIKTLEWVLMQPRGDGFAEFISTLREWLAAEGGTFVRVKDLTPQQWQEWVRQSTARRFEAELDEQGAFDGPQAEQEGRQRHDAT